MPPTMRGMANLVLGGDELDGLTVRLVEDADFVAGLDCTDGDWPLTAGISLVFKDSEATTWQATLLGNGADWNVDKAEVNALLGRFPADEIPQVRLMYHDGTSDLVWAQGSVSVKGW